MSSSSATAATTSPPKAVHDGTVRPSLSIRLIRHAESQNNQVYRDARRLFRGGTLDFDEEGWNEYVDTHRRADPGLSEVGHKQAQRLRDFLVPHLANQASHPVRVLVSPMRRTLETIRPTLEGLEGLQPSNDATVTPTPTHPPFQKSKVLVHAFYHESEGCHIRNVPQEGMSPKEISTLLQQHVVGSHTMDIDFDGFPDTDRGWYAHGTGAETRAASEARAAKFYVWLCEHLDQQLQHHELHDDVFDAGVAVLPGEEHECEHDKVSPRKRRRRTTLLVGHGDFMSLVLKRIVAGFGHAVETHGVPHRSAFVHVNTGITELEYFGAGRFLIMATNQTPHFAPAEYSALRTGGGLKDGWSYIVPHDSFILDAEVSMSFVDDLEDHVKEQTEALKALYLAGSSSSGAVSRHSSSGSMLSVEEIQGSDSDSNPPAVCFVVKRGLQVVGCAWYDEATGRLSDVVVRPSARTSLVGESLVNAVRSHARKLGRSGSLIVQPSSSEGKELLETLGFQELADDKESGELQLDV